MIRRALSGILIFSILKVIFMLHAGEHGWMVWLLIFTFGLLPWSLSMSYHQDAKWRAEGKTGFFDTNDAIKLVAVGFFLTWLFGSKEDKD